MADTKSSPIIGLAEVEAAAARLSGHIHRTPVLTSHTLDNLVGAKVYLKAECYQRAGAFKIRGALNKILQLNQSELKRGVLAWSSGNHAQAVALSAQLVGTTATILMPLDAPELKLKATKGYGAEVIQYDRYQENRDELIEQLLAERNCVPVSAFDDPAVIAGQGTAALELLEEIDQLDILLVPTSGGGLTAGCATVMAGLRPGSKVYGVEPEAGNDTKLSLAKGERVKIPVSHTIADGQQVETPGKLTFEINRRLVEDILLVSDAEILAAMAFLFDRMKVVAEPSGASALAALLAGKLNAAGKRVGVIISGGNVGLARFCQLLQNHQDLKHE